VIRLNEEEYTLQCNSNDEIKGDLKGAFSELNNENLIVNFLDNSDNSFNFTTIEDIEEENKEEENINKEELENKEEKKEEFEEIFELYADKEEKEDNLLKNQTQTLYDKKDEEIIENNEILHDENIDNEELED
jgi:hypothetical protein